MFDFLRTIFWLRAERARADTSRWPSCSLKRTRVRRSLSRHDISTGSSLVSAGEAQRGGTLRWNYTSSSPSSALWVIPLVDQYGTEEDTVSHPVDIVSHRDKTGHTGQRIYRLSYDTANHGMALCSHYMHV